MLAMSAVLVKCSVPKTASGIAKNNRPNGIILPSPCVCGSSSLRIFTRPTTSSIEAERYSQKIPRGKLKPASAIARRALAKSTNSKSIPLTPISDSEPPRAGRVALSQWQACGDSIRCAAHAARSDVIKRPMNAVAGDVEFTAIEQRSIGEARTAFLGEGVALGSREEESV